MSGREYFVKNSNIPTPELYLQKFILKTSILIIDFGILNLGVPGVRNFLFL
jgi:hypothetical protein